MIWRFKNRRKWLAFAYFRHLCSNETLFWRLTRYPPPIALRQHYLVMLKKVNRFDYYRKVLSWNSTFYSFYFSLIFFLHYFSFLFPLTFTLGCTLLCLLLHSISLLFTFFLSLSLSHTHTHTHTHILFLYILLLTHVYLLSYIILSARKTVLLPYSLRGLRLSLKRGVLYKN